MAEKSKIRWKKWVVALAILVAIAIVAVVVVFTIPKDVNKVKALVSSHSETVFLKDEDENNLYENSFLKKIDSGASQHSNQAKNVKTIALSIENVLSFYDNFLYLTNNNKTFQQQYGVITNSLKKADNYQATMSTLIVDVDEHTDEQDADPKYIEGAWGKLEDAFKGYLQSYADAFGGLALVFKDCAAQGVVNNAFSAKVLETIEVYLDALAEQSFKNNYSVNYFDKFVTTYLAKSGAVNVESPAFEYLTNQNLQTALEKMNDFSEIYTGKTLKDVIDTAGATGFTFAKSAADNNGALEIVKSFLQGGIS